MLIGNGANKKRYPEITLLHLIGAIMILLCHFFQKAKIYMLGELFITGVPLFLFVSGFLVGLKKEIDKKWLSKRAKRILVPYYLWIIPCILILWIENKSYVKGTQFLFLFTNIQGLNYLHWGNPTYSAVAGLGHLWFVTEIMVCSVLSLIFNKLLNIEKITKKQWFFIFIALILAVQPLLLLLFKIQTSYIITFFLGCAVAKLGCRINDRVFASVTGIFIVINSIRMILMFVIDGTLLYDGYIALLSFAVTGIWIFFFIFWLSMKMPNIINRTANNKIISYLSEISYEIYIVHMWFLNGVWQVSRWVKNAVLSDIVVTILTVIFSIILHFISKRVVNLSKGKRNNI